MTFEARAAPRCQQGRAHPHRTAPQHATITALLALIGAMMLRVASSVPALILLAAQLPLAAKAGAHEAPSGWTYPSSCCAGHDCYPLSGFGLDTEADGYHIKATGEVIPFTSRRIKPSGDGSYHRCSWGGDVNASTICLFIPSGS